VVLGTSVRKRAQYCFTARSLSSRVAVVGVLSVVVVVLRARLSKAGRCGVVEIRHQELLELQSQIRDLDSPVLSHNSDPNFQQLRNVALPTFSFPTQESSLR